MKRLPREWNFELVAVKSASRPETKPVAAAMQLEARSIADAIGAGMRRVVLDERGQSSTSAQLAERLQRWQRDGRDIALIIGGPDGIDPDLRRTADETMSLSAMTLPHGIARVMLLEQLYRAATVIKGHPYHRA